jgi:hypothetical protein
MSDIRKDYEGFANRYDWINSTGEDDIAQAAFAAGFQAGRAHDIDGLIAEIKLVAETGYLPDGSKIDVSTQMWVERICKHFNGGDNYDDR